MVNCLVRLEHRALCLLDEHTRTGRGDEVKVALLMGQVTRNDDASSVEAAVRASLRLLTTSISQRLLSSMNSV